VDRSSTRPIALFVLFSRRPVVLPIAPVTGAVLGPRTAPPTLPPTAPPNWAKLGVALNSAIAPIPAKKANFRICFLLGLKSHRRRDVFQARQQRAKPDSEPRSFLGRFPRPSAAFTV